MKLKGVLSSLIFSALIFSGGVQAQDSCRDNFPLELKNYRYEVRLTKESKKYRSPEIKKEDLEEWAAGYVDVEIKKNNGEYTVVLDAYSSPFLSFLGSFRNKTQTRFCFLPGNSKIKYKSLEYLSEDETKISLFPLPKNAKRFEYSDLPSDDRNLTIYKKKIYLEEGDGVGSVRLGFRKDKEFNVPVNTQDPLTLVVNLLANDYSETGKYFLGCIKGDNNKKFEEVYVTITKNMDNFSAELTFPENTLSDPESPFKIHYKKEGGKVKISRLELFISKSIINHWAIATPGKD